MRALALLVAAVSLSSCAALKVGWARVTWVDGGVAPEVMCHAKVAADGEVDLTCTTLRAGEPERDLLWKRERRRALGGTL